MKKTGLYIFVLIWISISAQAQDWKSLDADALFKLARQTAFDGKREEARLMLNTILDKNPENDDARVFLARTYGWDAQYDLANAELKRVLDKKPNDQQALEVLVDLGIWTNKFDQALTDVDRALSAYPSNQTFMLKKATILNALNQKQEAAQQIARLLEINPAHAEAQTLMKELKKDLLKYFVGVSAGVDFFSKTFNNAYNGSIEAGNRGRWGTAIARLNYVDRFSKKGWQPELEFYPRLSKKTYAYLNYGYSNSTLFPNHRVGAEVFSVVMENFELSAGLRHLNFNDTTRTTLYTGSFGYYASKYWISFRPFLSVARVGNAFSNTFTVRRYFSNSDNFLGFTGGLGFTPEERRFQSAGGLSTSGIFSLKTQRIGVVWQKTLPVNIILNVTLNLARQEQTFEAGNYLWITSGTVWIRKRF